MQTQTISPYEAYEILACSTGEIDELEESKLVDAVCQNLFLLEEALDFWPRRLLIKYRDKMIDKLIEHGEDSIIKWYKAMNEKQQAKARVKIYSTPKLSYKWLLFKKHKNDPKAIEAVLKDQFLTLCYYKEFPRDYKARAFRVATSDLSFLDKIIRECHSYDKRLVYIAHKLLMKIQSNQNKKKEN